jgi:hypothetical protein
MKVWRRIRYHEARNHGLMSPEPRNPGLVLENALENALGMSLGNDE